MPVVIKEIQVTATITSHSPGGEDINFPKGKDEDFAREIIRECVEQVMQILKDKRER